jgi:hypothetical protein
MVVVLPSALAHKPIFAGTFKAGSEDTLSVFGPIQQAPGHGHEALPGHRSLQRPMPTTTCACPSPSPRAATAALIPARGRRMPSLMQTGTDVMALAIDLSDHQPQALAEAAARLQVSEADLAAAAVRDLIAQPADDFDAAAQRVLSKNAELYQRLA